MILGKIVLIYIVIHKEDIYGAVKRKEEILKRVTGGKCAANGGSVSALP